MAKIKLTKSAVDTAEVTGKDYELRDTIVPGFLCKVTAHGRKVFISSTARTGASAASRRSASSAS